MALVLPIIILGSILGGFTTPTEAASIAVLYSLVVGGPQAIASGFLSVSTDPNMIIGMILMLLLIIGMFMDINATLIILAPVLAPLTVQR